MTDTLYTALNVVTDEIKLFITEKSRDEFIEDERSYCRYSNMETKLD